MLLKNRSLRQTLLLGVSAGSLIVAGVALAQDRAGGGRISGGRGAADPAAAAAQAAQDQALQAARASSASERAIRAFQHAAATRNAMRDAQRAARAAAQAAQSRVPNGLGAGGLQVANGVATDPSLWLGAAAPVQQLGSDGRVSVVVDQTQQKAILTWDSFHVGRETDLLFRQGGSDWVVLNRVTDAQADPSRILGTLKAQGSVYLINRNGVIFGGTAQVNVRSLIAASANLSNAQFLNQGIYSTLGGGTLMPSFTDAGGAVTVEAGAQIETSTPASVTAGGGFVLLMGTSVANHGTIMTPRGQAALVAGDDFVVRRGFGTAENPYSTTRGNEVRGRIDAGSVSGAVRNAGLIEASQGDITLGGRTIRQDGVIVATTGVNQRGTIHLLNSLGDTEGSVTLGKDSLTTILPELESKDVALDGQRDALAGRGVPTLPPGNGFDDRSTLADRADQSRVEIVTGGAVLFESGSQTIAQGGQVAVQAAGRITVADGARIDVSGVMGVALDMASNSIKVNVQGNELRDSPDNRESTGLKNQDVWIDVRDLVHVPSGTGGYQGDRWYTPGGLLEVGGQLGNIAHGIGEWAALGGTITLAAREVVAEQGAVFDISGGSLDYASGYLRTTLLRGEDGRLYDARNAPAGIRFVGLGNGHVRQHARWGEAYDETFTGGLFSRGLDTRWEEGYSVGRDAGRLILAAPTVLMDADIAADVFNGDRQTVSRPATVTDGYKLGQYVRAQAGTLAIGGYDYLGRSQIYDSAVRIGSFAPGSAAAATAGAIAPDRRNTIWLDAAHLSDQQLGGIEIGTRGAVSIESALTLAAGGQIDITAPVVAIDAAVTARAGAIRATNLFRPAGSNSIEVLARNGASGIALGDGATLDLRGTWSDARGTATPPSGLATLDGGSVSLRNTQNIDVAAGATIDVSSGAAVHVDGTLQGGRGGDVTLAAATDHVGLAQSGLLRLDGAVLGAGVAGGGTLLLQSLRIAIGAEGATPGEGVALLTPDRFASGFARYEIVGARGLEVLDGTALDVTMPAYRLSRTGGLELWTPPLYLEDPVSGRLDQRGGADLVLRTSDNVQITDPVDSIRLRIGRDATVSVDPGHAITIGAPGAIDIDGRLNAWGGSIDIRQNGLSVRTINGQVPLLAHERAITIGERAVLDVAGRAAVAIDQQGRRYGLVAEGGSITIGGTIDAAKGGVDVDHSFVVIRKGALLDASGAQAMLDLSGRPGTLVASGGGTIALGSAAGLYLDGTLKAASGGAGAAGGTLEIALGTTALDTRAIDDRLARPREFVLYQGAGPSTPGGPDALRYGHGALALDQIATGGFDSLALGVNGEVSFTGNTSLALGRSVAIYARSIGLDAAAPDDTRVAITAPYVRLSGIRPLDIDAINWIEASVEGRSTQPTQASLTVQAGLIDVRDRVHFGVGGRMRQSNGTLAYDRRGFADILLSSSGDLRFAAPVHSAPATRLTTAGALTLRAAQVYPTTNAIAEVRADTIRIERSGAATPAQPYSAFGQLALIADRVEQGGIVRAPFGAIRIGTVDGLAGNRGSESVRLLAGSITSVSGAGLVMPYGGTVDGITYRYADVSIAETQLGRMQVVAGVTLEGQSVVGETGAVIDISGGGTLAGAGFISGRGGSVDILRAPLAAANPVFGAGIGPSHVYALVPGHAGPAPVAPEAGAGDPLVGQQITLDAPVGGLAAGTYTLLPSNYALLPGAFRVEIADAADPRGIRLEQAAIGNGSFAATARLGVAGTTIRDALARQILITPAAAVRHHSLYNETDFSAFALADAARLGVPRVRLPGDAQGLNLTLASNFGTQPSFRFEGTLRSAPITGGWASQVRLTPSSGGSIEIVAAGAAATPGFAGVTVTDADLNALGAGQLMIGGRTTTLYGQTGNFVNFVSSTRDVAVRSGASLTASDIFLINGHTAGTISVEQGARLSTLGRGTAGQDSREGFIYAPGATGVFAVTNSYLTMTAPQPGSSPAFGAGRIDIGGCAVVCTGTTGLYSEGTIVAATDKAFNLDNAVRYGTRNLTLAVGGVNVGTEAALRDAAAANILPPGLALDQSVLDRLLRGDSATGAPAMETLVLNARDSINFFGTVTLDTLDPATGKSRLDRLVLTTGGIYGHGTASDVATIRTGNLIWNGATGPAPTVMTGGAGTGSGNLRIDAQRIELGFAADAVTSTARYDRLALGFAQVTLAASEQLTANHKGSLAIYERQGAYVPGTGFTYSGGTLDIVTPLVTGRAGSVSAIRAGGAIRIAGGVAGTATATVGDLGGELSVHGASVTLGTSVALPSGKLTLGADGNVTLDSAARIDLSGREVMFDDVRKYSWGGELLLESRAGSINQAAGSIIDLSARNNHAGTLRAIALAEGAGQIRLLGSVLGRASGSYDAGGSMLPYRAGSVEIRAQGVGDFAALNRMLNAGEVTGARAFQIKQGDLTIGDELRAGAVSVSLDGGALTVAGTIDASGVAVGTIRLAARDGLTLAGNALLDAHGTGLRVDSQGTIIDSPNRAVVALSAGSGTLTLAQGARIDLRAGTAVAAGTGAGQQDGKPRGTLELNAPRLGADDVAIDASGTFSILGAQLIAVNAVRRYEGAEVPTAATPSASGRPYQVIDQAWLDARDGESRAFIDAALANDALVNGRLAGLNRPLYRDAFHLRPGIEVATAGDLVVSGDLDLSAHRYTSLNPHTPLTATYGSGEVGSLVLRAGGDLSVYGSITDGFAPPPAGMPEEKGWVLLPGKQPFNADVVVPRDGIVLEAGTSIPAGQTLNYAVSIRGMTVAAGTRLPVAATLAGAVTLPANTVLAADVFHADGSIAHAAGTLIAQPLQLEAGMRLGAGMLLPVETPLAAMIWPRGVALPHLAQVSDARTDVVTLDAAVTLPIGARIPAGATLELGAGVESVSLRPGDGTGRTWALASMLPEGSQSWNLRLVAGADLTAADNRLTSPEPEAGSLVLADLHYGMKGTRVVSGGGGGPLALTEEGALYWLGDASYAGLAEAQLAERLMSEYGLTIEETFGLSFADLCASGAGICANLPAPAGPPALTEEGALYWLGDASYAGLAEAQLAERLMSEYGLTIEETFGLPFADLCAASAGYCAVADSGGGTVSYTYAPATTSLSVLRTGTGDLDLRSAGDLSMQSLFGVYTAGTSTLTRDAARAAGLDQPRGTTKGNAILGGAGHEHYVDGGDQSLYRAWYPDHGGNLSVRVGGNLTGDLVGRRLVKEGVGDTQFASSDIGNWLWRQSAAQGTDIPTAWWINFGTYASDADYAINGTVGFTGFGTLGGGNLVVDVAGDAGTLAFRGDPYASSATRSQGLVLAVGSTGRVVDGKLVQTGGGDLELRIGGGLNPGLAGRAFYDGGAKRLISNRADLSGTIVNLRGTIQVDAGAIGGIEPVTGGDRAYQDGRETRAYSPFVATIASATGGLTLAPGDATVRLNSRGDLVVSGVADAGRAPQRNAGAWRFGNSSGSGGGLGWFSLWTGRTAIDLFAAGGNLTPITVLGEVDFSNEPFVQRDVRPVDGRYVYPPILRAVAPGGNLYYGTSGLYTARNDGVADAYSLTLAPSRDGALEMLAGGSIYAGGYAITRSGAAQSALVTPFNPGFAAYAVFDGVTRLGGIGLNPLTGKADVLFGFGFDTVGAEDFGSRPARFYARDGDLVGVRTGNVLRLSQQGLTLYEGAGAVWMKAGRDIVGSGTWLGAPAPLPRTMSSVAGDGATGNLFVHGAATDVSLVSAGRDILYSTFQVAGPGQLEVTAGRNILQEGRGTFASLGAIAPGDTRPGASIALMAGMAAGADWAAVRARYLEPANLADPARPLADQPGKAPRLYNEELRAWLGERYGFVGTDAEARARFDALPAEQQRIFLRQVYYAELRAGGREYNDPAGPRFGSYLRGREAIATLFPGTDGQGRAIARPGDIILFGGSGVRTDFGGDIEMLAPGGQIVVGVQGEVPPASAGIVTQGQGDIRLFSEKSLLLGLSRIMTTFGGDIFAWSATGDINAGRGAKTTVLYTPPRRLYDPYGNVALAPQAPSSGAGIATLNPVPEVAPGDIDLIAPLGTIDAGEAGIRVSGNINLAALQVVNAANIQVQGTATGIPAAVAVNTGALTAASAATSAVVAEATRLADRARPEPMREIPSIVTVTFAGFGEE